MEGRAFVRARLTVRLRTPLWRTEGGLQKKGLRHFSPAIGGLTCSDAGSVPRTASPFETRGQPIMLTLRKRWRLRTPTIGMRSRIVATLSITN